MFEELVLESESHRCYQIDVSHEGVVWSCWALICNNSQTQEGLTLSWNTLCEKYDNKRRLNSMTWPG